MKSTIIVAALAVALAGPAFAQQVDIRATPPPAERPPEFVTPGPYNDVSEPRENPWYPPPLGVRVPYDPAFIAPASTEYETPTTHGRYGLAGWTSQNLPVGASGRIFVEQAGWLSFGFAVTWGPTPPRPAAQRVPPAGKPASAPAR